MDDRVPLHDYDSPVHHRTFSSEENQRDPVSYDESVPVKQHPKPKPRKSMSNCFKDSRRIDYVLVYKDKSLDEAASVDERKVIEMRLDYRERFMKALHKEGIEVQKERNGQHIFLKLHTPFDRMCKEAGVMNMEMPLKGCEIYDEAPPGCWTKFEEKYLETDNEVDYVSAPFQVNRKHIYEGIGCPETFFRPAHRSFLTHHILINIDVRKIDQEAKDDDPLARKGLPWMMHKGVFSDDFILHDESVDDPFEKEELQEKLAASGQDDDTIDDMLQQKDLLMPDTRRQLHDTWCQFKIKYQPLWKIRDYFGEKIALYFAWSGTLVTTLWLPTLFGLAVFIYGLYLSIAHRTGIDSSPSNSTIAPNTTETSTEEIIRRVKTAVESSLSVIKEAFDNEVTPFFALVICLWGTVFLEVWKRKNATLAYEWDVDNYEDMEPDRPQFYGTEKKPDPVTLEPTWYYPLKRQLLKYATSSSVLICMVIMVFISAAAVILYRVIMTVDYCTVVDSTTCLLISTVASSVLNAVSILILGKVYDKLAVVLTNWENHRTQTQYDDALILKLFAFQFANSYTSLFYIAFFRKDDWPNGLFGMGPQYQDGCSGAQHGGCMSMLSLQVLVLMLMKPLPKFLKDIVVTWLLKKWKKRKWCRRSVKTDPNYDGKVVMSSYLEREYVKADLGDFTLGEYTEKVIVYGFLMLFAASFPLAPLIALLITLIDIRVDARRMLWMYRRPLSVIAQDIGMWYNILQFLNIAGVISNGFLIAFTSSWGSRYSMYEKLWIVIIFEHAIMTVKFLIKMWFPDVPKLVKLAKRRHAVFAVKYILAIAIPDVPRPIQLAVKREKYQVSRILEKAMQEFYTEEGKKFSFLSPATLLRNKSQMEVEKRSLRYLDSLDDQRRSTMGLRDLITSAPEVQDRDYIKSAPGETEVKATVAMTSETEPEMKVKKRKSKKKKRKHSDGGSGTESIQESEASRSISMGNNMCRVDNPTLYSHGGSPIELEDAYPDANDHSYTPRPSQKYLSHISEPTRRTRIEREDADADKPYFSHGPYRHGSALAPGSGRLNQIRGSEVYDSMPTHLLDSDFFENRVNLRDARPITSDEVAASQEMFSEANQVI